jgi:hypothetical protein
MSHHVRVCAWLRTALTSWQGDVSSTIGSYSAVVGRVLGDARSLPVGGVSLCFMSRTNKKNPILIIEKAVYRSATHCKSIRLAVTRWY